MESLARTEGNGIGGSRVADYAVDLGVARAGRRAYQELWLRLIGIARPTTSHSIVLDKSGGWAWSGAAHDPGASRLNDLTSWMRGVAGHRVEVFIGAGATQRCSIVPYGIGRSIAQAAADSGVKLGKILPWWQHAFEEARRCVDDFDRLPRSAVCVVEGRYLTFVESRFENVERVHFDELSAATMQSLKQRLSKFHEDRGPKNGNPIIVLGHGLADGGNLTNLERELVLGRLDGNQPPEWLSPRVRKRD